MVEYTQERGKEPTNSAVWYLITYVKNKFLYLQARLVEYTQEHC